MKLKYVLFGVVMAILTVVCALICDVLFRTIMHMHFSLDRFTFALLVAFIGIYYYNRAEEMDKEK